MYAIPAIFPSCCFPEHLFLGTAKDNTQDMITKGRQYLKNNGRAYNARLTDQQVVEIKQLLKEGVYQKVIAKQFNVTSGTISHLNLNKTYKNVQELE